MTETSREYAIALFTLGKETNSEDEIKSSLDFLWDIFDENPQYAEFLSSPSIPKKDRVNAVKELLHNRVHEYVESFLCILCEKRQVRKIKEYIEEYRNLYNLVAEVTNAVVTSAVALKESEKSELLDKLQKKVGHTVTIDWKVDESIIGGLIVCMDGEVYDGSIRQHINDIKEVIYK